MREISKEEFKKSIIENVKNQYRRTIDEATYRSRYSGFVLCDQGCDYRRLDCNPEAV